MCSVEVVTIRSLAGHWGRWQVWFFCTETGSLDNCLWTWRIEGEM